MPVQIFFVYLHQTITKTENYEKTISIIDGCGAGRNSSIPDDGIYLLGTGLYAGREDLTTAVMPDNVYFGGEYVYADCPNLTTVVLSKRAASIPLYSFSGSSSLRDLYFYNEEDILLPYAYNHVFDNVPTEELTLHVNIILDEDE
jgi:hypothetical protein